ncbi:hypothetical protein LH425_14025 [Laribacter hongkongensis]|uniref:DUF6538 domain-containing protein n=1 Tax=Laribacter hongkongensis TaxID=168471 RepID=UPI001EFC6862|nr:DUF6538 domain-containing protein [Laribacter hongkongensis]MCG9066122.1 hypothetical protein [Laribacter hongkongensis]
MRKIPHTYIKSTGVYYFQLRIPNDLKGHFREAIVRRSLATRSSREADKRASQLHSHYLAMFESLRGDLANTVKLSPEDAQTLALKYRQHVEQVADSITIDVPDMGGTWEVEARDVVVNINQFDQFTATHRLSLDGPSRELAEAYVLKTIKDMQQESPATARIEHLRAKATPMPRGKNIALKRLVDTLIATKKPTESRKNVYLQVLVAYENFLGRKATIEDLNRDSMGRYRDEQLLTIKPSTWKNHAAVWHMLITMAFEDDLIPKPFKVTASPDDLKAARRAAGLPIFDQSEETRRAPTNEELREMGTWFPEHGAYYAFLALTGMRSGEVAQLIVSDIEDAGKEHGLMVRISDTYGRSLKNKTSVRTVPVPRCLEGFVRYRMEASQGDTAYPLFGGFDVDDFRRRFSAKKQRVYNNDTTLALHSLRHGFKAAGRAAGVPGDLLDYLTGHAPASSSSVAMSYGQGYAKAYQVLRGAADSIEATLLPFVPRTW